MKKNYEDPKLAVVQFSDVIVTSDLDIQPEGDSQLPSTKFTR